LRFFFQVLAIEISCDSLFLSTAEIFIFLFTQSSINKMGCDLNIDLFSP